MTEELRHQAWDFAPQALTEAIVAAMSTPLGPEPGAVRLRDLDPARPWLLTVAMMRRGDKLDSYRVLARALATLEGKLYLFGGWDGNQYVNSVYQYDPGQRSGERQGCGVRGEQPWGGDR